MEYRVCPIAILPARDSEGFFLKDLGYQPHIAMHLDPLAVGCRDPGAFLSSMLQRKEPEECNAGHILALGVNTDDAAFFLDFRPVEVYHYTPDSFIFSPIAPRQTDSISSIGRLTTSTSLTCICRRSWPTLPRMVLSTWNSSTISRSAPRWSAPKRDNYARLCLREQRGGGCAVRKQRDIRPELAENTAFGKGRRQGRHQSSRERWR